MLALHEKSEWCVVRSRRCVNGCVRRGKFTGVGGHALFSTLGGDRPRQRALKAPRREPRTYYRVPFEPNLFYYFPPFKSSTLLLFSQIYILSNNYISE